MRALSLVGLLAASLIAPACGGDSSSSDPNGGENNEGGQAGAEDPGGSEAGSSAGGVDGDAGDGAGGTTGGKSTAGAPSRGGVGGGTTPPGKAGGPGVGGGMPVPPTGGVGAGGGTPVEPPEGCRVDTESFSPGNCTLGYSCDNNEYVKTYCYDQGTGVWLCQCSGNSGSYVYQLTGVRDLAACEATAEICVSDNPTPTGPVECMPTLESRTASYCQLQQLCSQELDPDTGASLATVTDVYCSDDGTGRQLCNCTNQPYQYYVEGQDGTTACDSLVDYCSDPVAPTFEGAGDCRPQVQSGSSGYCDVVNTCLLTSEIADGIYVVLNDYQQTNCSTSAAGGALCSCNSSAGSFTFERDEAVTGIATCTSASELCKVAGDIEPEGEPTCSNTSQSAQGTYCNATLDCSASATIEDTVVSVHGYISLSCTNDGTAWSCYCSSGNEYATVNVEAETAWDACTVGSTACEEAVEVQYGNTGIGVPMPVPLPGTGMGGRAFK